MAFPSVVTPRGTSGALASSASHVVSMPASATTARGVLVVFTADGAPTISTASSGWTKLAQADAAGGTVGAALFYKRPGVTLASLTVNLSFAEECSYVVLALDGAAAGEDPTATSAVAATANGNPPSHTPAGGARDYLWVAAHCNESLEVATAGPAGYSGFTSSVGGPSGASTSTAERALNAASEDPGAFTSPVEDHVSWTIAIPPGVAVPTVGAGTDVASHKTQVQFTRTATENDNGNTITARSWTIQAGPTGVGTTIGTAAALAWTPTVAGDYTLQFAATNSQGVGTDSAVVSVYAPGQFVIFDGEAAPTTDVAGAFSFGTEFSVTDPAVYAVGIRWPRATTAATPDSARIEKVDGTVVAGTALSLSGGTVGAWNVTTFPTRVLLVEGQRYRTIVHYAVNYPALKTWGTEGRKDGPLEAPTNADSTGGGTSRYASGSPIASPTTAYNDVLWSDVVVEADSSIIEVSPTGIPSAEAFGTPTVTPGPVGLTAATGIGSAEAFGTPRLTLSVTASGIPSAEVVGTPTLIGAGAVGPTGIPSAEAFGTPTVTTGPVAVTTAGIPSVEAFGLPSVGLTVAPAGIGSQEAVGTPALTVGPVGVTAAGIASGEAFGVATVVAGPIGVGPTGIGSAEAFGTPRVSFTVYAVGIPSGEAFGTPTLLAGSVTITVPGIGSAEGFGTPEISVTLDPTKRIRPVRVRLASLYEVLVVARIPAQAGPPTFLQVDPIDWSKLTWSSTLSRPQRLSVSCRTSTITDQIAQRLRTPDRLPTELWVSRNGRRVFAGPLLGGGRNGDELTLECGGLLTYLQWMIVAADLRFDQVDQFGIAAALIDQWQALDYGHFGIDTTTVGASGVLRDRSYVRDEIHQVARRVEELGAVRDGFDTDVDPTTRKLQLWYPGKGIDRSTGDEAIVFDARAIDDQNAMFSIAPGDLASDAFGSGSKAGGETPLWSTQFNADLRAAFGRAAVSAAWSDVEEQGTLDDHVGALLDARDQPLRAPGQKVRVPADADLDAYDVGDTVTYELDDLLGIGGAWRIRSRTVTVETTGTESVDLEFV